LTFIPATLAQAARWKGAGAIPGPVLAHRVSPGYVEAFGVDSGSADDQETAEYGALYLASVSCLLGAGDHAERFVLVADTAARWVSAEGDEADFGVGELDGLDWRDVRAYYVDEPQAADAVRAAHAAVAGAALPVAWETPEVVALLAGHTLLWHDVAELPTAG
jgi:hypothetical protein